ncbi:MAG: response regulator [Akkermansiaceae bacterium]
MQTTIRTIIVEDHPDYREGVRFAMETEPDIELYATFGTAERALQSIRKAAEDSEPQPDIILLDLQLPGMSGLEAIPLFREHSPQSHLIVLSQSEKEADVLRAISSGASGYLLKNSPLSKITEGIRTVMQGGASLDASVARHILDSLQAQHTPLETINKKLTKREMQILELVSRGMVKKEISDELKIAMPTVATHVRHIYEKLGVSNAPSAINKAHRAGLLPPEG